MIWFINSSRLNCSGSDTDCASSEPFKTSGVVGRERGWKPCTPLVVTEGTRSHTIWLKSM